MACGCFAMKGFWKQNSAQRGRIFITTSTDFVKINLHIQHFIVFSICKHLELLSDHNFRNVILFSINAAGALVSQYCETVHIFVLYCIILLPKTAQNLQT